MTETCYKILSFLWDIPIEKTTSKYNEYLEVVWSNGRKMLNTRNANFSYGTCHDVFKVATAHISNQISDAQDILILGFGCGSILDILHKEYAYSDNVVGIEYDNTIISLYHKHFTNQIASSCELIHSDALSFLTQNKKTYDIIFIDLFIELQNSPILFEKHFLRELFKAKKHNTVLIFNTTRVSKNDYLNITKLNMALKEHFKSVQNYNFQDLNNIIIAK